MTRVPASGPVTPGTNWGIAEGRLTQLLRKVFGLQPVSKPHLHYSVSGARLAATHSLSHTTLTGFCVSLMGSDINV